MSGKLDEDMRDGDLVIRSGPRIMLPLRLSLEKGFRDDAAALGRRCVRSSLDDFLLFSGFGGGAASASISNSCMALFGSPLAMAELEVC